MFLNTGKKLKELREKQQLSVAEVSRALNIPQSTLRGYEYGQKVPADVIPEICNLFGLSPNAFFGLEKISITHIELTALLSDIEALLVKARKKYITGK